MFVVFVCLLALVCVLPLRLLVLWVSCWWSTCSAAVAGFVGLCVCWFCVFVVLVGCVFVVCFCVFIGFGVCFAFVFAGFVGFLLAVDMFCCCSSFCRVVLVVLWVRCFCCFCWAVKWKAKKERN